MKNRKLALALICALAIACIGGLSGCLGNLLGGSSTTEGEEFAHDMVQGELDMVYFNRISPAYEAAMDESAQELAGYYEQAAYQATVIIARYFDLDLSVIDQQYVDALEDQVKETYKHANYSVGPATRNGNDYVVPVTVRPFDAIARICANFDSLAGAWRAECATRGYDEYGKEAEELWAQYLTKALAQATSEGGYLEESTIEVRVELDSDGYYYINDDDYYAVDELILYFPPIE